MAKKKPASAGDVINFWFEEIKPEQWWEKSTAFDKKINSKFSDIYEKAAAGELFNWRYKPLSALAEIIILDQFPRNIFRDKKQSFATDPLAVCLSQSAIEKGFDKDLTSHQRAFMYMPLMHSESEEIHKSAELLFSAPDMENYLKFELMHKKIIDQFGRYPHRNKILGRRSKKKEIEFLKTENSSF
ncbi:MAG: DUF924 domain-containing protein [Kordiimonadaceae bacterium]|nr:DUF924 domain-containing protein [Kordiimonadaceae bacterium]MBT6035041.1 DUF924 domain-containing protein [Kordiimonadaceae bacterium]MBT6330251.1 DUF924 domain-containing protein [Kordiimonadaceae bacterium]MBT7583587.1 DUF924 domain-containing protein [Kordiimonadaceae bacterium]